VGYGDEIIGTGLARGLKDRGKLAAFGDGRKIIWSQWCEEMFAHNPNIARPGSEAKPNLEWIAHYKGARAYNRLENGRWVWNYDFKVKPGEFFFSEIEHTVIVNRRAAFNGFVVLEPNVPWWKPVAPNKDWGEAKYRQLCELLVRHGVRVVQFIHKNSRRRLPGITTIEFYKFRDAIATLSLAKLYIGPEGGMHHAAAALGIRAVVIMGGFIPPAVIGYSDHVNLTGDTEACGNTQPCEHCRRAMERISVDEVHSHVIAQLGVSSS
jgi:Glycosyltransferase family 9 (heptosyltransferase)